MGLRDIQFKAAYDSDETDILNEFYIPALSRSITYRRLAGFFSSSALAVAARGIAGLIKNGGDIKLLTGAKFRKADIEAIKEAYESPEFVMERTMLEELDNLEDEFIKDHVRALGWMVANKKLKIKVAIVHDEQGYPLDEKTVEGQGIFHQKVGILEDDKGNSISFSGSDNETATAWQDNIEEFKVFRSWIKEENEYFIADLNKFEKFWFGHAKRTKVVDIPRAVEERLIEIAPDNIDDLDFDRWLGKRGKRRKTLIQLRDYQKEAINSWIANGKRGIFEMATATGKTFAALGCLKKLAGQEKTLVVVIACPYIHLIKQWRREIEKFGIYCDVLIADSSNKGWKDKLADAILDVQNGISEKLIVLTTHATFPTDDFISIIRKTKEKMFLIVDEVHGIGAPRRKTGLIEDYSFRLGLSATPKRWFDLEGTENLFEYFGDVVFEFGLKEAIDRGYLSPYEYKPYFIELTAEEIEKYQEETAKIARTYYRSKDEKEKEELFSLLCINRQNIIKNAANKYNALAEILENEGEIRHCLIYCTPQQIDNVQDLLNKKGIVQHKFTQSEGTKPEEKYGGISERQFLLRSFSEGRYKALVAIKCLDEGVDVPPARMAIILANSGNPREYVQRRGRVLRNSLGKKHAVIYDIIVVPSLSRNAPQELIKLEKKILSKELKRYKEFAYTAKNTVECLKKIDPIEMKYKIVSLGEIQCL